MDESGAELVPPPVKPQLNRRVIGSKVVPLVTQVGSYELITPLFGGGVEPGAADPVTVIRGPEIRGHLRFWWRACRGGQFNGDLQKMKEREDELWGAASTEKRQRPSQVQIKVGVSGSGLEEQPFETRTRPSHGWRGLAYAAFPLQGDGERPPGKVRVGVSFTLVLTFPELMQPDIEAALWAWETFGGIGARTRRGFGALKLVSVDGNPAALPGSAEAEAKIREGLQRHVASGTWPAGVPHLSANPPMKVTAASKDPKAAWELLIQHLRNFRQSRHRVAASGKPGRSLWPEPDEIRRLTNMRSPEHANPLSTVRKFPRAAFGLPVVFHFKDSRSGDPYDTTLRGRDYDRMASPLILRPLACANSYVGLALVLEGTGVARLPGGLILKGAPDDPVVEAVLAPGEAQKIAPLHGNPDVLQAFLNTL